MNKIIEELKYGSRASYLLIGFNILIFIFSFILTSLLPPQYSGVVPVLMGGTVSDLVFSGELWRLVTANFLHVGLMHIGFNMFALYYYGKFIENYYSSKKLFLIYMISGIGSSMFTLITVNTVSLGASGAIFGLMGVMLGNAIRSNTYSPGLPINVKELVPYIVVWIAVSFAIPQISGLGHLGGVVTGFFLGLLLDTANTFRPSRIEDKLVQIFFWICLGIFLASYIGLIISFASIL